MNKRMTKKEYYLDIAKAVAQRSTCLKRHYGCIIVKNDEVIATGYNGSPRGEENCCDRGTCDRLNKPHNSGDYSDCCSVHAEQNAMLSASRKDMIGSVMYLYCEEYYEDDFDTDEQEIHIEDWYEIDNPHPCPICYRMLKNSGIKKVVTTTEEEIYGTD